MVNVDNIVKTLNVKGSVAAIKTDTVYGFVCNAFDESAVKKIYELKNRDSNKPLLIFIKSIDEIIKYVDESNLTDETFEIMNKYWPGCLTIIFRKKDNSLNHLLANSQDIGIRISNDEVIKAILEKVDYPLAQTSCNLSNEEPLCDYYSIVKKFGSKVDLVVDGGAVTDNTPSTIISVASGDIKVLRNGKVQFEKR